MKNVEKIGEEREWEGRDKNVSREKLEKIEREKQAEKRRGEIMKSRYNGWYKVIRVERIPYYMQKGWTEDRVKRIARFRLGNQIKERKYWLKEKEEECRLCGED